MPVPEISTPEKSAFVLGVFEHISNAPCCACSGNIEKKQKQNKTVIKKTKERLDNLE